MFTEIEDIKKLDIRSMMFDELAEQNPDHFAVRQYAKYKLAAGDICSK